MEDTLNNQQESIQVPDDWWPTELSAFAKEQPIDEEYVVVAEISKPWGPDSDKLLYTALVPTDKIAELTSHYRCIGYQVTSSGPNPSSYNGEFHYKPSFWIDGVDINDKYEPLVIRWESAGKTILLPDQGFLMTYGLMPRHCTTGETVWDDLPNRVFNVIKVEPPSEYYYKMLRGSRILIRREYLQDYATVRNMSLIQTYFVSVRSISPDKTSIELAKSSCDCILLPCRKVVMHLDEHNSNTVLSRI